MDTAINLHAEVAGTETADSSLGSGKLHWDAVLVHMTFLAVRLLASVNTVTGRFKTSVWVHLYAIVPHWTMVRLSNLNLTLANEEACIHVAQIASTQAAQWLQTKLPTMWRATLASSCSVALFMK